MPQPALTIEDIEFENLVTDPVVEKQVEANLITQNIINQNQQNQQVQKTAEEIAAEARAAEEAKAAADAKAAEEAANQNKNEEADENPISSMILSVLGEQVDEVEDTQEGIEKLLNTVLPKAIEKQVQAALAVNPMVAEFAEYVRLGGDPRTFLSVKAPELDYTVLELKNDDVATQEKLVRTNLAKQGVSAERIDTLVKAYKDTNMLFPQAEVSLELLAASQKAEKQNLLANQQKQAEEQAKEAAATWKAITTKVNEGKIAEATIPLAERNAFLEYISKPVDKQGNTQADLDAMQAELDTNLLFDYLRFKKLNLSDLISGGVKTAQAQAKQEKLKLKDKTSGDNVRQQTIKNPVSALDGITTPFDFQTT